MAKFQWEGVSRAGEMRKGVIEAVSEEAAANRLRADQVTPRKIRRAAREFSLKIGTGIKQKELQIITRQLATMIDAGLPLVQCLDILATQTDNPSLGKVLHAVKSSVESGSTFSDALRRHPKVFDELYVNLIHAGEVGGILDSILNRLSTYIEKSVKLKRQLKSALVYPSVVMFVALVVVIVMLTKVIPVFENMYKEFRGAKLPAPTQIVIRISNGFVDNWYWFAGVAFAAGFGLTMALRTRRGRLMFDTAILRIPVVGSVLRKIVVARFTRTLGTLLASGVPILDSLEICAKTSGNKLVENAIMYARARISEGKDLAGPLAESRVFPAMVVQMIGVGEQTGAMDQMLQKIADFYEDEVDVAVGAMTSLIEPLMMVFLGGVVGGLIIAMYLPVFELAGNISGE
ncbi:MAG TPA: type II secretion system F family protein [Kofleriaceae bacterium]|nr:type II secretion system F family protein [Kofleriaceae bacterium]